MKLSLILSVLLLKGILGVQETGERKSPDERDEQNGQSSRELYARPEQRADSLTATVQQEMKELYRESLMSASPRGFDGSAFSCLRHWHDFVGCTARNREACGTCNRRSPGLGRGEACSSFAIWFGSNDVCCENDECGTELEALKECKGCGIVANTVTDAPSPSPTSTPTVLGESTSTTRLCLSQWIDFVGCTVDNVCPSCNRGSPGVVAGETCDGLTERWIDSNSNCCGDNTCDQLLDDFSICMGCEAATIELPSLVPSELPTSIDDGDEDGVGDFPPTLAPSLSLPPSDAPSDLPSVFPSQSPSTVEDGVDGSDLFPTLQPSASPVPSDGPSLEPSMMPSSQPSDDQDVIFTVPCVLESWVKYVGCLNANLEACGVCSRQAPNLVAGQECDAFDSWVAYNDQCCMECDSFQESLIACKNCPSVRKLSDGSHGRKLGSLPELESGVLILPADGAPTLAPSASLAPSDIPSIAPSELTSQEPTKALADKYVIAPSDSQAPSDVPSDFPSMIPTEFDFSVIGSGENAFPTLQPSASPAPSNIQSMAPSLVPVENQFCNDEWIKWETCVDAQGCDSCDTTNPMFAPGSSCNAFIYWAGDNFGCCVQCDAFRDALLTCAALNCAAAEDPTPTIEPSASPVVQSDIEGTDTTIPTLQPSATPSPSEVVMMAPSPTATPAPSKVTSMAPSPAPVDAVNLFCDDEWMSWDKCVSLQGCDTTCDTTHPMLAPGSSCSTFISWAGNNFGCCPSCSEFMDLLIICAARNCAAESV